MVDLTQILPKLLRANPDLAVKLAWARAAGTALRRHAVPFRFQDGRLVISVADAIWQRQLQSMTAELIFRLNRILGQTIVSELSFRINPAAVSLAQSIPEKKMSRVSPPSAPDELLFAAGSIADDELRARFIRAAENCIARRDSLITSE